MSDIIKLALKARIPIISVETADSSQVEGILEHLSDRPVQPVATAVKNVSMWPSDRVVYGFEGDLSVDQLDYDVLLEKEVTLVLVNFPEEQTAAYRQCGRLVPPPDYVARQLGELIGIEEAKAYARYFTGMTMRDVLETIMLTQARDGDLSATGLNQTKSYLGAGLTGLEALDTASAEAYIPPEWAEEWMKTDAQLLAVDEAHEFWPKGFMLHGPAGTGKTELARWVAWRLGWPLYRLDLGSVYSRWQGQSEQNLRNVLGFISAQGQCVFLLDEAEKLFGNEAAGQASLTTLLSMLLWWLQGPTNRTITVMTTNRIEIIPRELYRPGRLDSVHVMGALGPQESLGFLQETLFRLAEAHDLDLGSLQVTIDGDRDHTPAELVQRARDEVKKLFLEGE